MANNSLWSRLNNPYPGFAKRKSEKARRRQARRVWLETHPEHEQMTEQEIVELWQKLGLVSPATYWKDVAVYKLLRQSQRK